MLLFNAFIFLALGVIWKSNDTTNNLIKALMLFMGVWNLITYGQ